jgi:hypothetical protein
LKSKIDGKQVVFFLESSGNGYCSGVEYLGMITWERFFAMRFGGIRAWFFFGIDGCLLFNLLSIQVVGTFWFGLFGWCVGVK